MGWVYHVVRTALVSWGYWAVALGILGENAGLPLPGETVLLFASFLSHKHTGLHLYWIIPVGTAAAIAGDNLGFFLGKKLGPTLFRWAKKITPTDDEDIAVAKALIKRRGPAIIFVSRFIFGLRTIAGPSAGALHMEWRKFFVANALGAVSWVTVISVTGYLFAKAFDNLLGYFEKAGWGLTAGLFALGYFLWRHEKRQYQQRHREKTA